MNKPVDDTGLVAIGARYYDPDIARFVSVDPVMDLSDPQQWHGYAYANNNPLTYADPTGLKAGKNHGTIPKNNGGGAPTAGNTAALVTKTVNPPVRQTFERLHEVNDSEGYVALFDSMSRQEGEDAMGYDTWEQNYAAWQLIADTAAGYRMQIRDCEDYQCAPPCPDQACQARNAGMFILTEAAGFWSDWA